MVLPRFRTAEYRRVRAWLFIALGSSAVAPVLHIVLREGGLAKADAGYGLKYVVAEGALYIVGVLSIQYAVSKLFFGQIGACL